MAAELTAAPNALIIIRHGHDGKWIYNEKGYKKHFQMGRNRLFIVFLR